MAETDRPNIKVVKTKPLPKLNVDHYDELSGQVDTVSIPLTKNVKELIKKWFPRRKQDNGNVTVMMLKTLFFCLYSFCAEIEDDCDDMEEMLADLGTIIDEKSLETFELKINTVRDTAGELMESLIFTDTGMERTLGMLQFMSHSAMLPDDEYLSSLTSSVEMAFENTATISKDYLSLSDMSEDLYEEVYDIWNELLINGSDPGEGMAGVRGPVQ